jgi:predicted nucleic acid-binding protein
VRRKGLEMGDVWVINASPLITLAKVGLAEQALSLAESVLIPGAVHREISAGPVDDPARLLLAAGLGQRIELPGVSDGIRAWNLGDGESEVLSLVYLDVTRLAVIDDAAARRCALSLGLSFVGTLGIVVRLKKSGLIASAGDVFEAIQQTGFWMDDRVLARLLFEVGE